MTHGYSIVVAAMMLIGGVQPMMAAGTPDPLAALRWEARVLLVLAPEASDPRLLRQQALFHAMGREASDRDLKLLVVVGDENRQAVLLRGRLGLSDGGFHAVLIGKDGGAKLTADEPLGADRLFPLIDAMPMRQDEMRRPPR